MLLDMPLPEKPERVIVLGAGRFGSSAAKRISKRWPGCSILIGDLKPEIDSSLPGEHFPSMEAMDFLGENLDKGSPNDLVVPCIPVHVLFNWLISHFGFCIPVPVNLMEEIPGAIAGRDGCIYASLSDFICPALCDEPEGYCPVKKEKRKEPLFKILSSIRVPSYENLTVRSCQLLPGTGAMTAGLFFRALNTVRNRRGRFLISTASRCHGVIHGFTH